MVSSTTIVSNYGIKKCLQGILLKLMSHGILHCGQWIYQIAFSIDYVIIYLFSIFFSIDFTLRKSVRLTHIAYIVIR